MKWDGPDLLVVRCSSFAARKGKRGKGDELRKGKDSSLFLCSKILTTSLFRQLPSPPWKQQRELRSCIEYDGNGCTVDDTLELSLSSFALGFGRATDFCM